MEDLRQVISYYRSNNEFSRFERQQLEFIVTTKLISKYFPKKCKILEVGAGPGQYSAILRAYDHDLTVFELVNELLEENKKYLKSLSLEKGVSFVLGDAQNLNHFFKEESFDAVVVMGPFYHLAQKESRQKLWSESFKLLKTKGKFFSTHQTRTGWLSHHLVMSPQIISQEPHSIDQVFLEGSPRQKMSSFGGYFSTPDEIIQESVAAGFKEISIHGQDPFLSSNDEVFNRLTVEQKLAWSQKLFELSSNPLTWGSCRSLVYVGEKV